MAKGEKENNGQEPGKPLKWLAMINQACWSWEVKGSPGESWGGHACTTGSNAASHPSAVSCQPSSPWQTKSGGCQQDNLVLGGGILTFSSLLQHPCELAGSPGPSLASLVYLRPLLPYSIQAGCAL